MVDMGHHYMIYKQNYYNIIIIYFLYLFESLFTVGIQK